MCLSEGKMRSIKEKLLVTSLAILLVALLTTGTVSVYMNYNSNVNCLEQTLTEAVKIAAKQVDATLGGYRQLVTELASREDLFNSDVDKSIINDKFDDVAKKHGIVAAGRTNAMGLAYKNNIDLSDREYFKVAKETGKPFVSDPVIRKDDGTMNIFISAPILRNGVFDGIVLIGVDATFLCNITSSITVGQTGNSAILDKNGTTIGYKDVQLVLDQYNTQKEAQTDKKLTKLAEIEKAMSEGKTGFDDYTYGGAKKYMAYAPIPNSNGWSIDVAVEQREFLKGAINASIIIIVSTVAFLVLGILLLSRLAFSIANPIKNCVNRIRLLSEGDLHTPVPTIKAKDETGELANITKLMIEDFADVISDITYVLDEMADGNLNVQSKHTYLGDFIPIKDAMRKNVSSINSSLLQINEAVEQVTSGSNQVSSGSQTLAQGATEQASSIEELSATITDILDEVKSNAENARQANDFSVKSEREIVHGNEQMQNMIEAMDEICKSSSDIAKIIKTIDDIAFQTNILALNAAVEAARAGSAGKGFAVVAEEVRNLAGKSAQAAKNTTQLIENSISAVENGINLANGTAESLKGIVENSHQVAELINEISEASSKQAVALNEVMQGVDQISAVVQTNSATAEESAAASEELNSQAHIMKELVEKFKLKKMDNAYSQHSSSEYEMPNFNMQYDKDINDKY